MEDLREVVVSFADGSIAKTQVPRRHLLVRTSAYMHPSTNSLVPMRIKRIKPDGSFHFQEITESSEIILDLPPLVCTGCETHEG